MNICFINGSPRGKYSTTLHTALYLQKRFPMHRYDTVHIAANIARLETDVNTIADKMRNADLIVFLYPVYTFLAPSQLHRFISAIKACGVDLLNRFVTQITTSKHFYDTTAHRYIEDNCHDLGMKVIHGLSADMDDLLCKKGQQDAERFFAYALWCAENDVHEPMSLQKPANAPSYQLSLLPIERKAGYPTVIVADLQSDDTNLALMIEDFQKAYPYETRLINIAEYPFQGGCLGCFQCAGDGKCIYRDGFDAFLRNEIQGATSAIVYAFTIRDHSMGPVFKMYDDRQFCNGHRTVTAGMPFAYIVNGDYPSEANLRTVIEARAEVGGNFLAGVGYDALTLQHTIQRLCYALDHQYTQPRNFYGVGGMKIFRDLIWMMRGLMKADHDFYKAHGIYDFPQKQWPKMLRMSLLGALVRNLKVKKKMGNKMNEGMIAPYVKIVEKANRRGD